jgi:oxysterol-binding protein-related protein 9/10/11
VATIDYAGRGWVYGLKNSFTATLAKGKEPLYKISGQWTGESTYTDVSNSAKRDMPFWNAKINSPTHISVIPVDQQGAWESRKVWKNVAESIEKNNVEAAGRYKSAIEIGQRKMRAEEREIEEVWEQRFFTWLERDEIASGLRAELADFTTQVTYGDVGSWVFDPDDEDVEAIQSGKLFESA